MARAIQKPEPTERGVAKDAKPSTRSQAWKRDERSVSQWFQNHDGVNGTFSKIATSTGRLGHITQLQVDSASAHYCIEVKRRETAPAWLTDCWSQINQIAGLHGFSPVLVLRLPSEHYIFEGKQRPLPLLHIITPERHAVLLACEREAEASRV